MKQRLREGRSQLNKRLAPAVTWFQDREPREQRILQLLAVLLAVAVVYWLIWQPSWNARQDARQRYLSNQQTLAWIEANADAVRAARGGGKPGTTQLGSNWVSEVSRSAQNYGLTLRGFTPSGNDSVRVQLENQEASALLLWLQSLEEQGLTLATLEMSAGDKSGTASLRATLTR
ncbi:type II secretion system protein GspM [Alloalcanivorax gelatiniphagus]|uniref:Type II secretion system protein M n=1 Tax=Alloalcanivorax gelatiniphagus TaxID=1194167 RepID=A0ABY2XNJ4_9GAMM|nr:type II secretion system protein M [Alloalcanivorax gelatiniphagus]TMW14013.1 type II secretion system protein M [Alloalcanivorax gelatiniphagus]|tara:strand:+ start:21716 stop:22240 length:525 start_codon:yes stop_codon:yes gene_type:complete